MIRLTAQAFHSNTKKYGPRGYFPLGLKFKRNPFNRLAGTGGKYQFRHGLPTGTSENLFGALSMAKPDFSFEGQKAPYSREQIVNYHKRCQMGEKIIKNIHYSIFLNYEAKNFKNKI